MRFLSSAGMPQRVGSALMVSLPSSSAGAMLSSLSVDDKGFVSVASSTLPLADLASVSRAMVLA